MFSYVSLEQRVPADHPLREVRKVTDSVLRSLSAEFDAEIDADFFVSSLDAGAHSRTVNLMSLIA